jgi:hypothetical protein
MLAMRLKTSKLGDVRLVCANHERLRFPFSAPLPVLSRERSKLQKPSLAGMQFEFELPKPLGKFRPKPLGIRRLLQSNHDVVRVPHDDKIALRLLSTPCLNLPIKDVRTKRSLSAA